MRLAAALAYPVVQQLHRMCTELSPRPEGLLQLMQAAATKKAPAKKKTPATKKAPATGAKATSAKKAPTKKPAAKKVSVVQEAPVACKSQGVLHGWTDADSWLGIAMLHIKVAIAQHEVVTHCCPVSA